jgi:hypothetical protein
MILFEQHNGHMTWRVDRPSPYDKGYAEDVPPAAVVSGAVALLSVPGIILGFAAGSEHPALIVPAALLAVAFAISVLYTGYFLLESERRWQERQVEFA